MMATKKLRDFKCTDCSQVTERLVHDDTTLVDCAKCGSKARKIVSAPKCFQNTTGRSPSASNNK